MGGSAGSISNYNQSGGELRALQGAFFGTGAGATNIFINGGKVWAQPQISFGSADTLIAKFQSTVVYSVYSNFDIASGPATATVTADASTLSSGSFLDIGTGTDLGPTDFPPTFSSTGGGTGKLFATNCIVNTSSGIIVGTSGGSGTFNGSGAGTVITAPKLSLVGSGGIGSVNLMGGASLKSGDVYVGSNGGNGSVTLSGMGTSWSLKGGATGNGTIGTYNGSAGTGRVELDNSATWNLSSGIVGFGTTGGGNLNMSTNAILQILSASRVNAIGFSEASGSTLEIGLDGISSAANGQLDLTGTASLAGTLDVVLENGFQPVFGEQFQLMKFATETGQFSALNLPAPYTWDTSKLYTQGLISVTSVPEPASASLVLLVSIAARGRRRKQRI